MEPRTYRHLPGAVTLLELLVVVLIISILATIATGVYTKQTQRARIAATHDLIHQLDVAITRYELDTGMFPPSGSNQNSVPPLAGERAMGSGYLHAALVHSMSYNALAPASSLWQGPYINLQKTQVSAPTEADAAFVGMFNILDPWGGAIVYVAHEDYAIVGANFLGGAQMFAEASPDGADPDLPAPNPFVAMGETYYNPSTYQLFSPGPNGRTLTQPIYAGAEYDDVNNFGY